MISNKNKLSLPWKVFKTWYEFSKPLLAIIAIICGLLTLLCHSAEGSHARLTSALIFAGSMILLYVMWMIDRQQTKKDVYRIYRSYAARKLEPRELIPLCFLSLLILIPFYILIITSLKTPTEANDIVFTWWPKLGFDLTSYKEVFTVGDIVGLNLGRALINSFVYSLIPLVVGLTSASLAAYAYSKLRFRGKKAMYQMLIATMMMPGCVTMATGYMMYDWYGWTNTPLPLLIPGCFSGASVVMFLREFFMGIPDAMLEAARIDGAGKWKCFRYVMIPMAKPAIVTQFILGFIGGFNDFVGPLIYLNDPDGYTIQVALSFMNNSVPDKSLNATVCVIALLPMLILYMIFQRFAINGICMSSGLKG